ncbi:MAG: hypothetical protein LBH92_04595 [Bacteroidales bacterium]|jgi:hypothetical protein|nr:hypothetical protein [Bacteroidales bacterium]
MEISDIILITTAFLALLIMFSFYALNKKLIKIMNKPVLKPQPPVTEALKQLVPMKVNAYERIILYVERIELEGLVMRTILPEMTAQQLQIILSQTIRQEFEHNLTQQLYVSELAWEQVRIARETILSLIGQAYSNVNISDNGTVLAKLLFAYTQDPELYQFENYTTIIKREMKKELQ